MFAAMRRVQGGFVAALTAAILVTALPIINDSGTGTAELALTAFYAGSLVCLLRWLERMELRDLILCALFSGAMAWTKNEGLAMAVINGIVGLLFTRGRIKRKLLATMGFILMVGAIYLPWVIYSHDFPRTDEDYASRFTPALVVGGLQRLPQILRGFIDEMSALRKWGGLWVVMALTAILGIGRPMGRATAALWAALLMQIGVLTLAYVVSVFTPQMLLPLSVERLVMHMTPAAALLIAYQWQSFAQVMPMSARVTSGR
jgi:Dolichyl-phosphate-mannose-protein mannosyltransferase